MQMLVKSILIKNKLKNQRTVFEMKQQFLSGSRTAPREIRDFRDLSGRRPQSIFMAPGLFRLRTEFSDEDEQSPPKSSRPLVDYKSRAQHRSTRSNSASARAIARAEVDEIIAGAEMDEEEQVLQCHLS